MIYWLLFVTFFKVGIFGFGGGYAILPMIYQDIQQFGILSANDFSNLVALSQVTPGPIAINAATYVGFKSAGLLGACIATVGVSLPSFILILSVVQVIKRFSTSPIVLGVMRGIRPATVGLLFSAFVFMAQTAIYANCDAVEWTDWDSLVSSADKVAVIIFVLSFFLVRFLKIGAIKLTFLGAILGVILCILFY